MSTDPATHDVRALAATVRDGELTSEQREHLVDLLHSVGTAATLAQRAHYPDNDAAAPGYLVATWEPVATAALRRTGRNGPLWRRGARRVACTHLLTEVSAPG